MTGATSRVKLGTAARAFSSRAIAIAASGTARARRVELRMLGVICTPKLAEHAANLTNRAAGTQRLPHGREEVRVRVGGCSHLVERRACGIGVPFGPHASGALALPLLDPGVH